jgi:hypothetical protein
VKEGLGTITLGAWRPKHSGPGDPDPREGVKEGLEAVTPGAGVPSMRTQNLALEVRKSE